MHQLIKFFPEALNGGCEWLCESNYHSSEVMKAVTLGFEICSNKSVWNLERHYLFLEKKIVRICVSQYFEFSQ